MMVLRVNEVFYSLQGEGRRTGDPSIFIRLAGCSAKHACAASGVVCDTEFESGSDMTPQALLAQLEGDYPCKWIVWTGGEPLDQLTPDVLAGFRVAGYLQAVETSGVRPLIPGFDWVTLSPKVAEHVVAKHFPEGVDELKYVRQVGQAIPQPSVTAKYYYLSPHANGNQLDRMNLQHCVDLCLQYPQWSLSEQSHKRWGVR